MAVNQIQGMQWGAPGDEAGHGERRDGREDTYNVGLRSLQEMGPEAGVETGRPALAGLEAQVSAEAELLDPWAGDAGGVSGAGCGLLVHSGLTAAVH